LGEKCSAAIKGATTIIEQDLMDQVKALAIKEEFGCENVTDNIGFLYVLADIVAFAVQYNTSLGIVPELCGNFTTSTNTVQTYVDYAKLIFGNYGSCEGWDISSFTNETSDPEKNMRQWMWQSCNELGYFQTAPTNNSLRSELITPEWHLGVCNTLFGVQMKPKIDWTNANYGGQDLLTSNTIFTNGGDDPWRVLSVTKPLGVSVPAIVIPGEAHCSNWYASSNRDSSYLKNGRALGGAYINAFITPCASSCSNHGVCVAEKTGDTTVESKCVCYSGWNGDTCENAVTSTGSRMVPWWAVVVAGAGAIVIGAVIGVVVGRRRAVRARYSALHD
jgi:hypothetical protein